MEEAPRVKKLGSRFNVRKAVQIALEASKSSRRTHHILRAGDAIEIAADKEVASAGEEGQELITKEGRLSRLRGALHRGTTALRLVVVRGSNPGPVSKLSGG